MHSCHWCYSDRRQLAVHLFSYSRKIPHVYAPFLLFVTLGSAHPIAFASLFAPILSSSSAEGAVRSLSVSQYLTSRYRHASSKALPSVVCAYQHIRSSVASFHLEYAIWLVKLIKARIAITDYRRPSWHSKVDTNCLQKPHIASFEPMSRQQ